MSLDHGADYYGRYLEGDDTAVEDLIREYNDGLILYLRGMLGSFDAAEEMAEETYVRIVTKKPKFAGYSVVVNHN